MSRLVIIAGLAVVLISLVGLATLAGGPNQPATEGASRSQESVEPNSPETPEPETTPPSTTPETTTPDATTPGATTPEATTEQETIPGPSAQDEGEGSPQGIRPSDRRGARIGPRVVNIEITGDSRYSCSLGNIDSPRTIRGSNPAPFQVRITPGGTSLDAVMAVCQKISGDNLGVSIVYDGEIKAQDETTDQFGTVSASWSPVQQ